MNSVKGTIITKCVILMSMNAKPINLFSKLLPLNPIKLDLNLETKLKLFSIVHITNIDINFIFS